MGSPKEIGDIPRQSLYQEKSLLSCASRFRIVTLQGPGKYPVCFRWIRLRRLSGRPAQVSHVELPASFSQNASSHPWLLASGDRCSSPISAPISWYIFCPSLYRKSSLSPSENHKHSVEISFVRSQEKLHLDAVPLDYLAFYLGYFCMCFNFS